MSGESCKLGRAGDVSLNEVGLADRHHVSTLKKEAVTNAAAEVPTAALLFLGCQRTWPADVWADSVLQDLDASPGHLWKVMSAIDP